MPSYPLAPPELALVDCAGQCQAALMFSFNKEVRLLGFDRFEKHKNGRIYYCNILFRVLLGFSRSKMILEGATLDPSEMMTRSKNVSCEVSRMAKELHRSLKQFGIVTIVKVCRSHVWRAARDWGAGKNPVIKSLCSQTLDWASDVDCLAEAVCIMCVAMAALKINSVSVSKKYFNNTKTPKGKEMAMKKLMEDDVAQCVDNVQRFMEKETMLLLNNHSHSEISETYAYSANEWPCFHPEILERAMTEISGSLVIAHMFHQTKKDTSDENQKNGESASDILVQIVLGKRRAKATDIEDDYYDENRVVRFSVEQPVTCICLDFPIQDSSVASNYLNTTWMPTIAMWSRCSVNLLECSLGIPEMEGSNQYAEGSMRDFKANHTAIESSRDLVVYYRNRYDHVIKSAAVFASNLRELNHTLEQYQSRRHYSAKNYARAPIVLPDSEKAPKKIRIDGNCNVEDVDLSDCQKAYLEENETTGFGRGGVATASAWNTSMREQLQEKYFDLQSNDGSRSSKDVVKAAPLFELMEKMTGSVGTEYNFSYSTFNKWYTGRKTNCSVKQKHWILNFLACDINVKGNKE